MVEYPYDVLVGDDDSGPPDPLNDWDLERIFQFWIKTVGDSKNT